VSPLKDAKRGGVSLDPKIIIPKVYHKDRKPGNILGFRAFYKLNVPKPKNKPPVKPASKLEPINLKVRLGRLLN
jgi:hypothetical protein